MRHVLFNKLTPIMLSTENIDQAATKLLIQKACSEITSELEQLIKQFGLDADKQTLLGE